MILLPFGHQIQTLSRFLYALRSIWGGLPTFIQEVKRKGDPSLKEGEIVDAELSPSYFNVEAGFTLTNPDDYRYQTAVKHRTHFGHVIHKAAVALREGREGGEDHIDAIISTVKVNYQGTFRYLTTAQGLHGRPLMITSWNMEQGRRITSTCRRTTLRLESMYLVCRYGYCRPHCSTL